MNHHLVALDAEHDISGFDCGENSLNTFLAREARGAHASGASRTHVWVEPGQQRVIAYFTLLHTTVEPSEIPRSERGSFPAGIPGYLIGKLALDTPLRGRGLGKALLLDALAIVVRAADAVGGRLVVVDALDNTTHGFYQKANFIPIESSYRLWMKVATARAALTPSGQTGQIPIVEQAPTS